MNPLVRASSVRGGMAVNNMIVLSLPWPFKRDPVGGVSHWNSLDYASQRKRDMANDFWAEQRSEGNTPFVTEDDCYEGSVTVAHTPMEVTFDPATRRYWPRRDSKMTSDPYHCEPKRVFCSLEVPELHKMGAYELSDILEGKPMAKSSPYPSTSSISTDAPHMPTGDIDDIAVPVSKAKTSSCFSIVSIQKLIKSLVSCKIGPGPAKIDEHEIII
ncbi:unnamed protein product [Vitrella brassicaformis CCMP3155]|uniref:Uncharacterized protein n=1 Tax=Vitrella brassicaformis (strain CCMP3155) TaxID=1169540 RepID=A0A0G4H7P9_VITBC|nr:unnamed protein product [Vitrella brassicaformis CCMP3155]|eukprot:CEM39788.1 unnamed protein product [Vitrella brassicaformis CCMP3155]